MAGAVGAGGSWRWRPPPKSLRVSVDISDEHFRIRHELEQAARDLSVDFEFRIADDLAMEPLASDLLFIDTTHTYEQTLAELNRFGPLARKKIVLHDMTTAGVYQAVFQWLWDNIWRLREAPDMQQ